VGCVFDVVVRPTYNRQTGETLDLAHAVRNSYVAHLGGPSGLTKKICIVASRPYMADVFPTEHC